MIASLLRAASGTSRRSNQGQPEAQADSSRSRYLSTTALARGASLGSWPAAFLALPLALAPSGAGANTIPIPTSCTLTGPTVCLASKLLSSPGSASDTIAFQGGVLALDGVGKSYSQQATLDTIPTNIINQDGHATTFNGIFSNAGANPGSVEITNIDNKTGNPLAAGSVAFTKANTYTGTTTIDAGATLNLGTKGSIANSAGVVDNGTLSAGAANKITTLSGGGSVQLSGGAATILTLTNASGLFSGAISLGGGLTIGAGTETLSGANTYTGPTAIGAGAKLAVSGPGTVSQSSGVDVANGGAFDISGANGAVSIKTLTGTAGSSVILGGNTLNLTAAGGKTFHGAISGGGGVTVQQGTITLDTGAQAYTGQTTVSPSGGAATLKLAGTAAISASSGVLVDKSGANTGTFDISGITPGTSTTIQTLSGAGNVALGTKELKLSNASGIFTGVITGTGKLTIDGGKEAIMGNTKFSGTTTVSPGASLIGTGTVAGLLSNSGTVSAVDPVTGNPGVFHAGKFTQTASGTLDVAISGAPGPGTYSQLFVTGSGKATLGGTLAVTLLDGFEFSLGASTYENVLTFGVRAAKTDFVSFALNGSICSSGGPDVWNCGSGLTFTETFDPIGLDLTVMRVATPEPGTLAVLASGLLGLMAWRRRRN